MPQWSKQTQLTDIVAYSEEKDIMDSFPANSNKSKETPKKKTEKNVEKVVTGEVVPEEPDNRRSFSWDFPRWGIQTRD
jgi:hypothetical protein